MIICVEAPYPTEPTPEIRVGVDSSGTAHAMLGSLGVAYCGYPAADTTLVPDTAWQRITMRCQDCVEEIAVRASAARR